MIYRKDKETIIARMHHGDNLNTEIINICEKEKITSGYMPVIIGGLLDAELISMKFENEELISKQVKYEGPFEIAASGTIALKENKVTPHIHISLAKYGNGTISGHLVNGTVGVFMEVVIVKSNIKMVRKHDIYDKYLLNFEE